MQTNAEDVRVRQRAADSSRDGETKAEGEEAESRGHDEEFVLVRECRRRSGARSGNLGVSFAGDVIGAGRPWHWN